MTYSLETEREFERLEYQSTLPQFDVRHELRDLAIPPGARVLDAGTGSGIVARHLAASHPSATVVGCDLSEARIARAQKAGNSLANLTFTVEDLLQLRFPVASFDVILCRYVLEHFAPARRRLALAELVRCLAPGGKLCVIDVDGAFTSIYPTPEPLPELIARLRSDDAVDLDIGRKLPSMLFEAGLSDVRTRVDPVYYRRDEADNAAQLLGWTLEAVQPHLARLLGSVEKAAAARTAFLDAVREPGGMFFCHKFVVTGHKPAA